VEAKPCQFKINREILHQPVEPMQAWRLLAARETGLPQIHFQGRQAVSRLFHDGQ
jgi:hypothetical protein